ncbi:hypothetical protein [Streptosporangium sp. NPDC002524]|uniref:hypothetical protein n=1 Tax=Streptosporangium sp. NPDC002524 TaxID=3154537 RepID=UPI00332C194A
MNETWAASTVQFIGLGSNDELIAQVATHGTFIRDKGGWHVDFRAEGGNPLGEQLKLVEQFLADVQQVFDGVIDGKISLHLSWTPREPQDGIIFNMRMIKIMASMDMAVLLDTYMD